LSSAFDGPSYVPIVRTASGIKVRELEPLWPGVLWRGKSTLLGGDPGLGKSLVTVDIAARVSRGDPWPCTSAKTEPGTVLMISAEDEPEDTIVPRLVAAGADLDRIQFFEGVRDASANGHARPEQFLLDRHVDVLRSWPDIQHKRISLVVVDPISAFMGRADSHNNAEVRALLSALGTVAAEKRFAALVVTHLNKGSGANAMYRFTGSLGFIAAARAAFAVVRDPQDQDQRLVLPVKVNLGPDSSGFSYRVSVDDNDKPIVKWGDERVTRTAEARKDDVGDRWPERLLAPRRGAGRQGARDHLRPVWIQGRLALAAAQGRAVSGRLAHRRRHRTSERLCENLAKSRETGRPDSHTFPHSLSHFLLGVRARETDRRLVQ
jgi:putative DNA primase/helicase